MDESAAGQHEHRGGPGLRRARRQRVWRRGRHLRTRKGRGRHRRGCFGAMMFVAGVLAAGSLAGCGTSASAGSGAPKLSGQTLTVYTQAPFGSQLKGYEQYYAYIADAFHKATGSTIKWVYSTSAVTLSQELENAAATGSGPDVFSIGSSFNGTASALHEFYVLSAADWAEVGGQSAYVPKMLTMSGPSNSQDIGVPFESIPYVMVYNKALFARAGITSPPTTWSQFVADGQAVQKASPGVNGSSFAPSDPYGPWKPVWSYMEQMGGDFLNAGGTTAMLTSPALQAALQFYFGLEEQYHIIPKADLTWEGAQEEAAFLAGKTGEVMDSNYSLIQASQGTPVQGNVEFAPMPNVPYGMGTRPPGGQPAESIVSGNYYDVAKYYGNLPLALAFIKAATSTAAQVEQFKVMGWMPVTQSGIAAVEQADPGTVPFIQAEQNSTPTDFTPAWSTIETGVLAVIAHVAQQLATGHPYSGSYVMSQLQAENAAVQPHLSGS